MTPTVVGMEPVVAPEEGRDGPDKHEVASGRTDGGAVLTAPPPQLSRQGHLGHDFGVLVEEAQKQGLPLSRVRGGNANMKKNAENIFGQIAKRVIQRATTTE